MDPLRILLWAVVLGAGSVAVTKCVRALPPFSRWLLEAKKPWACDLCMTFWGVAFFCLLRGLSGETVDALLLIGPCSWTVGFGVLQRLSEPTSAPPMMMPEDSGEDEEMSDAGI